MGFGAFAGGMAAGLGRGYAIGTNAQMQKRNALFAKYAPAIMSGDWGDMKEADVTKDLGFLPQSFKQYQLAQANAKPSPGATTGAPDFGSDVTGGGNAPNPGLADLGY